MVHQPVEAQTTMNVDEIPSRDIASQVASDAMRNTIFFAVGAGVIYWLGGVWPLLGTIGLWLYVVTAVLDTAHVSLTVVVPGVVLNIAARRRGTPLDGEGWLLLATLFRIVELVIFWYLVMFLWNRPLE